MYSGNRANVERAVVVSAVLFESRTRSRSPISARIAALMSELRLRAFRMKYTPQVVAQCLALEA